jgi:propanediol utilization protein
MPADAPWLGEWVIDGQTVIVDADTVVEGTPGIGLIAKVKALVQPDDSLLAIKIGVEEEEEELEEVEIEGNIGDMPADAPWLGEWVIDGQTVIVDADTVIEGTPEIGLIAKVKALVQLDDSLLAIKIEV